MPSYILRLPNDDDEKLWKKVHEQAQADGVTVRAAILALLKMYVDGKVAVKQTIRAVRT